MIQTIIFFCLDQGALVDLVLPVFVLDFVFFRDDDAGAGAGDICKIGDA